MKKSQLFVSNFTKNQRISVPFVRSVNMITWISASSRHYCSAVLLLWCLLEVILVWTTLLELTCLVHCWSGLQATSRTATVRTLPIWSVLCHQPP